MFLKLSVHAHRQQQPGPFSTCRVQHSNIHRHSSRYRDAHTLWDLVSFAFPLALRNTIATCFPSLCLDASLLPSGPATLCHILRARARVVHLLPSPSPSRSPSSKIACNEKSSLPSPPLPSADLSFTSSAHQEPSVGARRALVSSAGRPVLCIDVAADRFLRRVSRAAWAHGADTHALSTRLASVTACSKLVAMPAAVRC